VKEFGLIKCWLAVAVLTTAVSDLGLAQFADSAGKGNVELVARLEGQNAVDGLAFSPDGKILAASYPWHTVILWDVAKGKPRAKLDEHHSTGALVFTPDGKRLVIGGERFWDIYEGKKTVDLEDESGGGGLAWVAFSRDGKVMATGGFKIHSSWTVTGVITLREPKDGKVQKK